MALSSSMLPAVALARPLGSGTRSAQDARQAAAGPVTAAPDSATAVRAARAQGSRVEVADLRTETRTVFAEPKGTMTAELSSRPVRVRRGDAWVAPDATLVRRPDGSVGPKAPTVALSLSGGGEEPLVRYGKDGKEVALSWPEPLPAPALSGGTATYPDVFPGVDLEIHTSVDGFAQYLVVKDAAAARNPALARIRLGLRADGVTLRATKAGALEARDGDGKVVFAAPVSRMWDSGTPRRAAAVRVALDGDAVILRPDQELLSDPATTFPVTIDPAWHTPGLQAWTSVVSGNPTVPYPNRSADPRNPGWAQVGQCYNADGDCNGIGIAVSYFQYDTTFLAQAGRQLMYAGLDLIVAHSPNCGGDSPHWLFKSYDFINPGTTWNNRPGGIYLGWFPSPKANARYGCGGEKSVGLDVTSTTNTHWPSVWIVTAGDENDQLAWRKYSGAILRVQYNDPPNVPSSLSTDPPLPAPCKWCEGVRYIGDSQIRLRAAVSDPNGDPVQARWRIETTGEPRDQRDKEAFKPSGQLHDVVVDLSGKHGKTVNWWVKGHDGHLFSNETPGIGPFAVDRVPPDKAPNVSARLYKEDNRWHGGVGVPDTFTFNSAGVDDVNHFLWGWSDPPTNKVDAADRRGGSASVTLTPPGDGPRALHVQSVDRAGHRSPTRVYHIYVRAGSGPLAQWSFEGNANDEAFLGDRHGTLHGTAKYGPGAVGLGLELDGLHPDTNMGAPNTVRTDTSFSVAAWVKPRPARTGQVMGAVSQDGAQNSGFYLQYRGDLGKWAFLMVHSGDEVNPPGTSALSVTPPQPDRWTHLVGVYDRLENELRLYVNGALAAESALPAGFVPWHGGGNVKVGRQKCGGNVCDPWSGSLDEVKLYDRVLSAAEVAAMVGDDGVQAGQWKLDELNGTTARNAVEGGEAAVLHNGASFTGDSDGDKVADGGAVGGALRLDGTDDHAATSGPAVRTDQSFTAAGWVKLDRAPAAPDAVTAVSQDGSQVSGFYLGYRQRASGGVWELYAPSADAASRPADEVVVSNVAAQLGVWTHLAAVYDGTARQVRLYVNGALAGTAARNLGFDATGPLVVGRGRHNGAAANHWPGMVDEVRAYSRALSAAEVQGIVSRDDVALGEWKLDGNAGDASGNNRNGTLNGTPDWTGGQTAAPDQTDLAVRLNGTSAHVSAPHTVNVTRSFAVAAWARPDGGGSVRTVLSQDGNRMSAFRLRATADGRWSFAMQPQDVDGGGGRAAEVIGGAAQAGVWTHLVAEYDAAARRLSLYVNGVLAGTADHNQTWDHAAGGLQIGRAKTNGAPVEYFNGAVDDVAVYGRVLFAAEIRAMAGRDLTLAHNWPLDEGSGPAAADAVGRRTATLSGGAAKVPGRLGNAVSLDGVDDVVSTAGVDVATDTSFTVSAWVRLTSLCDPVAEPVCKRVAVSVDATDATGTTSKFRLGHTADRFANPDGVWVFEMPESSAADAPITKAAVTVLPSERDRWVHLAGVYDKPTRKLWLYVNGTRKGDGTLNNAWQATGGLRIGRARGATGQPGQHFPGMVDDVRMYSGPLDDDRIGNLYNAYLKQDQPATLPAPDAGYWKFDENAGTTGADSSGRGQTATLQGGASWNGGGRKGATSWLNGVSAYAETAGAVLNTAQSFSAAAWVYMGPPAGLTARTAVAQDAGASSSFMLQYRHNVGRWAVVVPRTDPANPAVILSTERAVAGQWTHLALAYDANLDQLRLYVNGRLSAAQVGVVVPSTGGKLSIGRGRWNNANVDYWTGGVDDVRAFAKALSDGEVQKVYDDTGTALVGQWRFDDSTVRDSSWRNNPTTASGGVSYVAGLGGRALALDGTSGAAAAQFPGSRNGSMTVSAWAKLTREPAVQTVVAQDGSRTSEFVLQYQPTLDRWVFGAPSHDGDDAELLAARSAEPAVLNQWVHLTGVYDHAARQVRLYVNGVLQGSRNGVTFWGPGGGFSGGFTIGRGQFSARPAWFFAGSIDEVQVDMGIVPDAEIARRGAGPAPP